MGGWEALKIEVWKMRRYEDMIVSAERVKMQREGMRITGYGLGGKIKELKAEGNEALISNKFIGLNG